MKTHLKPLLSRTLPVAAAAAMLWPSVASAQIKQPGAHPDYSVELEPHLLLQWAEGPMWHSGAGFGGGLRATIPFLQQGPISKINNSMGITFGLDAAWFSGCYNGWYYNGWRANWGYWNGDCSGYDVTIPVALQWNFWLTPVVSVFGEPGLAISYEHGSFTGPPQLCGLPGGCTTTDSWTGVEPVFWAGARFLVSDIVAITVRLGVPTITAGVSFLL
jgi:hypothetical protein